MSTESFNPSPKTTGFANASLILALASVIVSQGLGIEDFFTGFAAGLLAMHWISKVPRPPV